MTAPPVPAVEGELSIEAAAVALGCSVRTVSRLLRNGDLQSRRHERTGQRLIAAASVAEFRRRTADARRKDRP